MLVISCIRKADRMLLWIFFVAVYLTALVVLGMSTLRKGHTLLFIVGIFFPFLWLLGAILPPAEGATR